MTTASNRPNSANQHRRETLLHLIVPMIGVGVIVLAGGVLVFLLPRRSQVAVIADWMLTVMTCCPAVLCLFAVCIALVAAIAGMNKLHVLATQPLDRIETLSRTVAEKTAEVTDGINQKTADISAKFAFANSLLGTFDTPDASEDHQEGTNHDGTLTE